MPNQNVSMQFDYEPDTNQKFKCSTSYVYLEHGIENGITVPDGAGGILGSAKLFAAESDGAGVQNGTTRFTAALLPDANNPKDNTAAHHPKYVFHKAEIVSGKEKKTLSKTVVAGGTAETFSICRCRRLMRCRRHRSASSGCRTRMSRSSISTN